MVFDRDPRDPIIVSMVRHPVARALSHFGHARHLPRLARLTPLQLASNKAIVELVIANFAVRFFSARSMKECAVMVRPRPVGQVEFERALERLHSMDAVGLTEAFEASARLIARAAGVTPMPVRMANIGPPLAGDRAEDSEVWARIEAAAEYDMAFYAAAKRRFDADLAALERQSAQAKKEAP